ncbi:MAG TPA: hypothetical protein VF647_11830 [Longimicrobium sp.]|jgi:hypothetical protein
MPEDRGRPDDFVVTHTPVAYGWGGMIVRDGVGEPMPDEMALEFALPEWAENVPDTGLVVDLCFTALRYDLGQPSSGRARDAGADSGAPGAATTR